MRYFIFFAFLFIQSLYVQAQRLAEDYWHEGGVAVTDNGDTLEGRLKYDLDMEVVMVDQRIASKTLSSRNLQSFYFFDKRADLQRIFWVLPYAKNPNTNYETPTFFEMLTQGRKITLLGRERIVSEVVGNGVGYYGWGGFYRVNRIENDFFLMNPEGKIVFFSGRRDDLFRLLKDESDRLKEFIKKNRLNLANRFDMIKIIDYYNQAF